MRERKYVGEAALRKGDKGKKMIDEEDKENERKVWRKERF